jgi:hypothetical protein
MVRIVMMMVKAMIQKNLRFAIKISQNSFAPRRMLIQTTNNPSPYPKYSPNDPYQPIRSASCANNSTKFRMNRGFSTFAQRATRQVFQRGRNSTTTTTTTQRSFTTGQATTTTGQQATRTTNATTTSTRSTTTNTTTSTTVGGRQQQQQQQTTRTTTNGKKNQQQQDKTKANGRASEELMVGSSHRAFQALLARSSKLGGLAALSVDAYLLTHFGTKDEDV